MKAVYTDAHATVWSVDLDESAVIATVKVAHPSRVCMLGGGAMCDRGTVPMCNGYSMAH